MVSIPGKLLLIYYVVLICLKDNIVASNQRNVDLSSFVTLKQYDDTWIAWKTLRFTKSGPNKFVITGDLEFKRNMGDEQYVEIKIFHKSERSKNNNKSVVYYDKKPICKYMAHDKLVYPHLLEHSNLPARDVCPFPQGEYTFQNFVFEADSIPPAVPNGEYKVVVLIYDNKKDVAGFEIELAITNQSAA